MRKDALALTAMLTLVGCARAADSFNLRGTNWTFEKIDGQRPANPSAGLSFRGRKLKLQVGCNHTAGPWRIDDDRLVAGPLKQTEQTCNRRERDQERIVNALLVVTPRMAVDGSSMVLQSSTHTVELARSN
jgi:heat shock protein HslJ